MIFVQDHAGGRLVGPFDNEADAAWHIGEVIGASTHWVSRLEFSITDVTAPNDHFTETTGRTR